MAERMWFKGRAAMALDAWYSGDVETNLANARRWLEELSFDEMVERLNASAPQSPEFRYEYRFDYPLDHSRLQGPQFEKVIRTGYLEAIALAFEHSPPVPIRTYWMTGAGNDEFEMHISDDVQQVSVTLFVPDVEGGSEHPQSPEAWVVTIADDGEAVARQMSGPRDRQQPSLRAAASTD